MRQFEKRRHVRVETSNCILYELYENEKTIVSRSMGKAVNISQSGILLETPSPIEVEAVTLFTADLEGKLIEINGKVIYCRETESGIYQSGVSFIGSDEETAKFAVKLVKLYHHRKQNVIMQIAA